MFGEGRDLKQDPGRVCVSFGLVMQPHQRHLKHHQVAAVRCTRMTGSEPLSVILWKIVEHKRD